VDSKYYILILALVVIIAAAPLVMYNGLGEEQGFFKGSDDAASKSIEETGYQPWFKSIWEPPSAEVESLIFALQAAIGAVILGFILGYYTGKSKERKKREIYQDNSNSKENEQD
jgi:cobalt/nickel transport protein